MLGALTEETKPGLSDLSSFQDRNDSLQLPELPELPSGFHNAAAGNRQAFPLHNLAAFILKRSFPFPSSSTSFKANHLQQQGDNYNYYW